MWSKKTPVDRKAAEAYKILHVFLEGFLGVPH